MNTLQVIPYLSPRRGGDVEVCCSISRGLARKGHNVTIATSDFEFDTKLADELERDHIEIVRFPCRANIGFFLISPSMNDWLNLNLKEYDLAHLHDFRSYQNVALHKYAVKKGIHYLLQPHGSIPRTMGKETLKLAFDLSWGKRILRDASGAIAVSRQEAHDIEKTAMPEERIFLIYNGMNLGNFVTLPMKGEFKKKMQINGRMLLYVGRIHKSKGIDFAILSFAHIADEFGDTTMVICGHDDGYKSRLVTLTRELGLDERVRFFDFIDEKTKVSAYVDADVFFHTVRYMAGVGLAPLEALLCGTPVIVTKECSEIVQQADAGFVVEYGNAKSLAGIFRKTLLNPDEAVAKANRGRKYITDNLSWDSVIGLVIDKYSTVTERRRE